MIQIPYRCNHIVCHSSRRTAWVPCVRQVSNILLLLHVSHLIKATSARIVESTLRTMNNLLERLHASFFFYILTSPGTFMKIGMFLPSAILVSVAMLFKGLGEWVDAGWICEVSEVTLKDNGSLEKEPRTKHTWRNRRRPMLSVLTIMMATHVLGVLVFNLLCSRRFGENRTVSRLDTSWCCTPTRFAQ